jgi:predicted alpha/beta-fold hydrolase
MRSQTLTSLVPFRPAFGLSSGHLQTILGNLRLRRFSILKEFCEERVFETEPDVQILGFCHWQRPNNGQRQTVVLVHGLEGSAEASYMLGTASKAFAAGFNVVRLNVRNCGGTEHLTPHLYHSGLTTDLHFVVRELSRERHRISSLTLIGFSMGGNQVLKLGGEWHLNPPPMVAGICAVSPPIDLAACSRAIGRPQNRLYEYRFLRSLKAKVRRKEMLFPDRYDASKVEKVSTMWGFDDVMAPHYGFTDAQNYYECSSAIGFLDRLRIPTLIIQAQDDPFIPFDSFRTQPISGNPWITLLAPAAGGHVSFCGRGVLGEDRAWAENRCIEFALEVLPGSAGL